MKNKTRKKILLIKTEKQKKNQLKVGCQDIVTLELLLKSMFALVLIAVIKYEISLQFILFILMVVIVVVVTCYV